MARVGDEIRIKYMEGEPTYTGKTGFIEFIDDAGQLHGTWGGCAVIPETDKYETISRCVFCGKEIKEYGNSAAPAVNGTCCDSCNNNVVVPYRVFLTNKEKGNVALLVKPDALGLITPKNKYFTLKEHQKAVEGHIELAPQVLPNFFTVVNEEGLLLGLPHNKLAHLLFNVEFVGNVFIVPAGIFEKQEED